MVKVGDRIEMQRDGGKEHYGIITKLKGVRDGNQWYDYDIYAVTVERVGCGSAYEKVTPADKMHQAWLNGERID